MSAVEITVERHYLDWPLGQTINQEDLSRQLGVHATGINGGDLTSKVVFNLTQVNIDQEGEYPVGLSVMDPTGQAAQTSVTLNIRPLRKQQQPGASTRPATQPTKKKHGWLVTILVVIILLCIWWGVSAHNKAQQSAQEANNSQQSSQINDNSGKIDKLSGDNQKLANQVAELKGAVKQYQKDQDQQELNNRLDKIESQNQQLQSQVQNNSTKEHLNEVTKVVNQVRNDPSNGVKVVNNLKNESGFSNIWNEIDGLVQSWVNKFAN